jgi:RNA polymerase sigma-70 factor (ECF subfamily)
MSTVPTDIPYRDSAPAARLAEPSDDTAIIARVLGGEAALFELLMRRHNQRLFRAARAIVKNDDEAEDVMQEAYVNAYLHLSQFEGRAKFSTWLTRIAVHEALSRVRVRVRERHVQARDSACEQDYDAEDDAMSSDVASPEEAVSGREVCAILEPLVDALPEGFRVVFVLRAIEGLSVDETADCLGLVPETVRTRFFRARRLLRQVLVERGELAEKGIYQFRLQRCDRVVARVLARIGENSR